MFIDSSQPRFGAPAERDVLVDEYIEPLKRSFRSAGAKNLLGPELSIKIRSLRDSAIWFRDIFQKAQNLRTCCAAPAIRTRTEIHQNNE